MSLDIHGLVNLCEVCLDGISSFKMLRQPFLKVLQMSSMLMLGQEVTDSMMVSESILLLSLILNQLINWYEQDSVRMDCITLIEFQPILLLDSW